MAGVKHRVARVDQSTELATLPALQIARNAGPDPVNGVQARLHLGYNEQALQGLFVVMEAAVLSRYTEDLAPVWQDSCVELFLQPPGAAGYLNLEFNAGGCLYASWVTDPRRDAMGRVRTATLLTPDQCKTVRRQSSLPTRVDPEYPHPTHWQLAFHLPWSIPRQFTRMPEVLTGSIWRANAYKCAEHNSRPHWLSWAPLPSLDFHQPAHFGELLFVE